MVSVDRNGRVHGDDGRFVSEKSLSPSDYRRIAENYTTDSRGRVHRPDGTFATEEQGKKISEIKLFIESVIKGRSPPGGGPDIIYNEPEGFEGLVKEGNFVSKKWALYYECTCKVNKDSPRYTSSEKIIGEDGEDGARIIKHWMAVSTWSDYFSLDRARALHDQRWPNHRLLELVPLEAKIKPELRLR